MFFTHLLACPWGSMKSGHLLENCTMIPFSTDRVSLGRPDICQFLILTGSPNIENRLAASVCGTLNSTKEPCQDSTRAVRYSPCVKEKRLTTVHTQGLQHSQWMIRGMPPLQQRSWHHQWRWPVICQKCPLTLSNGSSHQLDLQWAIYDNYYEKKQFTTSALII